MKFKEHFEITPGKPEAKLELIIASQINIIYSVNDSDSWDDPNVRGVKDYSPILITLSTYDGAAGAIGSVFWHLLKFANWMRVGLVE